MKFVPNAVSRKVAGAVLTTSQHSPALLFGVGVVGFGATVVLACRGTLRLEEVLVDAQKTTQDIKTTQHVNYSEKDRKHDLTYHYVHTTGRIMKLYGPAIIVGSLSVAALTGSHHVLSKRNAGLTAAYAALEKGFNQYRARVVKEFGEDKDREFRYGTETREIVEETETGPVTKTITTVGPQGASIYAKFFDQFNKNWQTNPELNKIYISQVQNYMNDRLHARGYLFLNEVYEALGLDISQAGQVVGWRMSKNSDNYVDFGLYDPKNGQARDFINGREGAVLLDFNVDGVIFDKIEEPA